MSNDYSKCCRCGKSMENYTDVLTKQLYWYEVKNGFRMYCNYCAEVSKREMDPAEYDKMRLRR